MTAPMHTSFLRPGERLKLARERAGVGVQAMADALERHRNAVTRYEHTRDESIPLWVLRTYAEKCGNVSVAWLADESGEPPTFTARSSRAGPHPLSQPVAA